MGADEGYDNDVLVFRYLKKITPIIQKYVVDSLKGHLHDDWWIVGVVGVQQDQDRVSEMVRATDDEERMGFLDIPACCYIINKNHDVFKNPIDEQNKLLPIIKGKHIHWLKDDRNYISHSTEEMTDEKAMYILHEFEMVITKFDQNLAEMIHGSYEELLERASGKLPAVRKKKKKLYAYADVDPEELVTLSYAELRKLLQAASLNGAQEALRSMASNDGLSNIPHAASREPADIDSVQDIKIVSSNSIKKSESKIKNEDNSDIQHSEILCCNSCEIPDYDEPIVRATDSSDRLPRPRRIKQEQSDELDLCTSIISESDMKYSLAEIKYNDVLRYFEDSDTELDKDSMMESLKRSADLGYGPAQYALACMYCSGLNTQQSFNEAYELFKKSFENGVDAAAYYIIAMRRLNLVEDNSSDDTNRLEDLIENSPEFKIRSKTGIIDTDSLMENLKKFDSRFNRDY